MRDVGEVLVLGLSNGAVYALLAVGLVLVYQTTRVLNFAQAEAGSVAMYASWWLAGATGLAGWITGLFGIAVVALLGLAFERWVVRPMLGGPRLSISVATLGMFSVLGFLPVLPFSVSPQFPPALLPGGVNLAGVFVSYTRVTALAMAVVLAVVLWSVLTRTTFGLGMLAAAEDPTTVRLMGVRLGRISAFTWTLAFALGGVAGILVLTSNGLFFPFQMTIFFVRGLAAALVGGLNSLSGAIIGGVAVGLVEQLVERTHRLPFVDSTPAGLVEVALLAIILAVLLLRPHGVLARQAAG